MSDLNMPGHDDGVHGDEPPADGNDPYEEGGATPDISETPPPPD